MVYSMYMLPRIVLSFVLLSSCTWVHGQGQWGIIAGPQIARVGLDPQYLKITAPRKKAVP